MVDNLILVESEKAAFWIEFEVEKAVLSEFIHDGWLFVNRDGEIIKRWFCLSHDILAFKHQPSDQCVTHYTHLTRKGMALFME